MKILTTKNELKAWRSSISGTVGFVPTMGFLHEGHAELIRASRAECDNTVLSIFVNPTQFGPTEDLDRYPRDFDSDSALAEKLGVDVIFYPSADEMYHFKSSITFSSGTMANELCGKSRPGHFDGVLQVVTKLFHLVHPTHAYFGQKDAQQLALIESLVLAYDFPVTIRKVPTVRESDGLAKSSRNVYLTELERQQAPIIYQALREARDIYTLTNTKDDSIQHAKHLIEHYTSGKIDYLDFLTYPQLESKSNGDQFILAVAVFFSKARLIDNILIERVKNNVTNDVE